MDLTTLTPAQIDEAWAPVASRRQDAQYELFAAKQMIAKAKFEATRERLSARVPALGVAVDAAKAEEAPFIAEYERRDGWTRAYIVSGGHVHRHTYCHTLYPTTKISWLPSESGKDEAEIVELAGERACTVCYPSAPVDVLKRPSQLFLPEERKSAEEKVQRAQELAAKRAAKAAKAITNPDGTPLRGRYSSIDTEVTAEREAVDLIHNHLAYDYEKHEVDLERILVALAHKRGTEVDEQRALVTAKAEKKAAKTKREMAAGR